MSEREMASPMREAAIAMHEMYSELRAAGFNRSEAMELVVKTVGAAVQNIPTDND